MITKNNFGLIVDKLDEEEIIDVVEDHGDYVNLAIDGNHGGISTFESSHSEDRELIESGMVSCDKEAFLRLLDENDRLPKYFSE